MSNRKVWDDNVSQGWRAMHKLSWAMSYAIENCGNRDAARKLLKDAVTRHVELEWLKIQRDSLGSARSSEMRDSMVLEWATNDMFAVLLSLLHSLGRQLDLWDYEFEVSARFAKYRVVLFSRADRKAEHTFTLASDSDAAVLAAAWRTLLESPEKDVQLQGITASGNIVLLPVRKLVRRKERA
jgi:hypothetical protein